MLVKMEAQGVGGGSREKKATVGMKEIVSAFACTTDWASGTPSVGDYYFAEYDVSDVNSFTLTCQFNAGPLAYIDIGYEIDGTFTRINPSTTITPYTENISSAKSLKIRGNVSSSTGGGAREMGGFITFA